MAKCPNCNTEIPEEGPGVNILAGIIVLAIIFGGIYLAYLGIIWYVELPGTLEIEVSNSNLTNTTHVAIFVDSEMVSMQYIEPGDTFIQNVSLKPGDHTVALDFSFNYAQEDIDGQMDWAETINLVSEQKSAVNANLNS